MRGKIRVLIQKLGEVVIEEGSDAKKAAERAKIPALPSR